MGLEINRSAKIKEGECLWIYFLNWFEVENSGKVKKENKLKIKKKSNTQFISGTCNHFEISLPKAKYG
jgi:hypothetical protein